MTTPDSTGTARDLPGFQGTPTLSPSARSAAHGLHHVAPLAVDAVGAKATA